jgi:HEAT repeat protein
MRPFLLLSILAVFLSGCGKGQPTLAGGKPLSHWLEALKDPDAKQRKTAVFKLGNVGPGEPEIIPALVEMLKDRDAGVRGETILALVKFGPAAAEAVPALTLLQTQDPDGKVREYASKALAKLQNAEN